MTDLARQSRQYYLGFNLPVQLLALATVLVSQVSWMQVLCFFVIIYWLGVQAGSHKLFAHRSWTPRWSWMRYLIAVISCFGMMGGPVIWASVHRWHHAHSDSELDPHTPRRGVWHAYWAWLMHPPSIPLTTIKDHVRDRKLLWIDKHCREIVVATLLLVILYDHTMAGDLMIAMALTFHCEMAVNAFLHQQHDGAWRATNLSWLSLPSGGSSLHANHHERPNDPNFSRHWSQPDPSYWFVRLLGK